MANYQRISFCAALLQRIGAPVCENNILAILAWQYAECTNARWNPLATTLPMPGATNFNQVGVKNYTSFDQGVEATARTLLYSGSGGRRYYAAIVASLQRCDSPEVTLRAVANSPWGTGDLGLRVLPRVRQVRDWWAQTLLPGSDNYDPRYHSCRASPGAPAPGPAPSPPPRTGGGGGFSYPDPPTLRQGDRGPWVTKLQRMLAAYGFNPGPIDGIFGPRTAAAVRAFQQSRHLAVDGIVGPQTWGALLGTVLRQGSRGPLVAFLQELLREDGLDPGPVDGIFGPRTEAAVREAQRRAGIVVDGVVGPQTWRALLWGPSRWPGSPGASPAPPGAPPPSCH